jgi:hypothetical protein
MIIEDWVPRGSINSSGKRGEINTENQRGSGGFIKKRGDYNNFL